MLLLLMVPYFKFKILTKFLKNEMLHSLTLKTLADRPPTDLSFNIMSDQTHNTGTSRTNSFHRVQFCVVTIYFNPTTATPIGGRWRMRASRVAPRQ